MILFKTLMLGQKIWLGNPEASAGFAMKHSGFLANALMVGSVQQVRNQCDLKMQVKFGCAKKSQHDHMCAHWQMNDETRQACLWPWVWGCVQT